MSKILASLAGLALLGTAALPLPANAQAKQGGPAKIQSTEVSSQHGRHHARARHHWRGHRYTHRLYGGPRRYWGPRYGYYDPYPYYYGPPVVSFGVGPFGFRVF
jgi:hypothetical protein